MKIIDPMIITTSAIIKDRLLPCLLAKEPPKIDPNKAPAGIRVEIIETYKSSFSDQSKAADTLECIELKFPML